MLTYALNKSISYSPKDISLISSPRRVADTSSDDDTKCLVSLFLTSLALFLSFVVYFSQDNFVDIKSIELSAGLAIFAFGSLLVFWYSCCSFNQEESHPFERLMYSRTSTPFQPEPNEKTLIETRLTGQYYC